MKKLVMIILVAIMALFSFTDTTEAAMAKMPTPIPGETTLDVFKRLDETMEAEEYVITILMLKAYDAKNPIAYAVWREELLQYQARKKARKNREQSRIDAVIRKLQVTYNYKS